MMRFVLAAAVAVVATAASAQSGTLHIQGNVTQPLTMSIDDIKRLPRHAATITPRSDNAAGVKVRSIEYQGALLRDILVAAKPVEHEPRELRRSYVVASARDGYTVVFSWAELFVSPAGDSVLVAYQRDGEPLSQGEGPLAVVSGVDTSAARHVKWLESIELRAAK